MSWSYEGSGHLPPTLRWSWRNVLSNQTWTQSAKNWLKVDIRRVQHSPSEDMRWLNGIAFTLSLTMSPCRLCNIREPSRRETRNFFNNVTSRLKSFLLKWGKSSLLIHKQASHFTDLRSYPNRNPATEDARASVNTYSKWARIRLLNNNRSQGYMWTATPKWSSGTCMQEGWLGCLANLIVTKTEKFLLTKSALIQFPKRSSR